MAQAMKRLPIDARAKCKGTRSGVSITKVSSVVITAAIVTRAVDLFLAVAVLHSLVPNRAAIRLDAARSTLFDQTVCSKRQASSNDFRRFDFDNGFVTSVNRVKMSRWMVTPKHANDDAVES